MRLSITPIKHLLSVIFDAQDKNLLFYQRLFWGALLGCFVAFLVENPPYVSQFDSPYIYNLQSPMINWRYQLAQKINLIRQDKKISGQISLVNFDDNSQFELGIARFNSQSSQRILARALEKIEKYSPLTIVLDLDLRGAICPDLVRVFRQYHNVVLALFGHLDGSTDLPSSQYTSAAKTYGYDELPIDDTGYQLLLNHQILLLEPLPLTSKTFASVPSLAEATLGLNALRNKMGRQILPLPLGKRFPIYFSSNKQSYPSVPLLDVVYGNINPALFANRIVIMSSTLTSNDGQTVGDSRVSARGKIHADIISTILNNEQIYTLAPNSYAVLLFLLGASFCSIASVLNLGWRACLLIVSTIFVLAMAQILFQLYYLMMPILSPLTVLFLSFILATFNNLETGIRLRNRELAQAHESMQVRAEAERQRIAEDLHDETLPALSTVARMADRLNKELGNNPIPAQMRERLDFTANEMRRVINDLHPSVLETMGFKPALENLLTTMARNSAIGTSFTGDDNFADKDISKFCQLQLYRIVQECLNNVNKHARATIVNVNIARRENRLILSVVDNGAGMPVNVLKKESHGILNIKQRAQLIAARVDWSKPPQYSSGTEVRIEMSLNCDKEIQ